MHGPFRLALTFSTIHSAYSPRALLH